MPLVVPKILPWTFYVTEEEEAGSVQELGILVVGFNPKPTNSLITQVINFRF